MVWGKGRIAGGIDLSQDWDVRLYEQVESHGVKASGSSVFSVKGAKSEQLLPSTVHSLF